MGTIIYRLLVLYLACTIIIAEGRAQSSEPEATTKKVKSENSTPEETAVTEDTAKSDVNVKAEKTTQDSKEPTEPTVAEDTEEASETSTESASEETTETSNELAEHEVDTSLESADTAEESEDLKNVVDDLPKDGEKCGVGPGTVQEWTTEEGEVCRCCSTKKEVACGRSCSLFGLKEGGESPLSALAQNLLDSPIMSILRNPLKPFGLPSSPLRPGIGSPLGGMIEVKQMFGSNLGDLLGRRLDDRRSKD